MTPTTNLRIITIVVLAIAIDATIGIVTLAFCMIMGVKADPTLITAFVGLTSGLSGALSGLLVNTRTQTDQGKEGKPVDVEVKNLPEHPVPTSREQATRLPLQKRQKRAGKKVVDSGKLSK